MNSKNNYYKEVLEAINNINLPDINMLHEYESLAINTKGNSLQYETILIRNLQTYSRNIENLKSLNNVNEIWGSNISLKEKGLEDSFDDISGGVNIDTLAIPEIYRDFFRKSRWYKSSYSEHNRGFSYYASSNPCLDKEDKLKIIETDICDALILLNKVKRENNIENLPYFIAVVDYLKSHFITLLHSLCFEERIGKFKFKDKEYQRNRRLLTIYTRYFTRMYYKSMLGLDFDKRLSLKLALSLVQRVILLIKESDLNSHSIKQPELEHPIIEINAAIRFRQNFSKVRTIVGVPSGGTELAFLTELMFETFSPRSEFEVFLIPVSRYSILKTSDADTDDHDVINYLKQVINNISLQNEVLVVDDNSNTGLTAEITVKALRAVGFRKVNFQVAEVDIYRTLVKNIQWNEPPETISNPLIFRSSVGIVPITYGNPEYKDFKQLRKIERIKIIEDYYKKSLMIIPNEELAKLEMATLKYSVKICGVHNINDLVSCINNGVDWIGVHVTYQKDKYLEKVLEEKNFAGYTASYMAHEYLKEGDLSIPWSEYDSLKEMFQFVDENNLHINITLLVRPLNSIEVINTLKALIPEGFKGKVYLQIQSDYNSELITNIVNALKKTPYKKTLLLQTVGMDKRNAIKEIRQINSDNNIKYLLLDTNQRGGTGKSTPEERLLLLAKESTKPIFIAGGLNNKNIESIIQLLVQNNVNLFGVDIESSVELDNKLIGKSERNSYLKIRKDYTKIENFINEIKKIEN